MTGASSTLGFTVPGAKPKFSFSSFPRSASCVERVKSSKVPFTSLAGKIDLSNKPRPANYDPRPACFTRFAGCGVFSVFNKIAFLDISPTIISSNAVDMVNHLGPKPSVGRKCDSMSEIRVPVEGTKKIAMRAKSRKRSFPRASSVPLSAANFGAIPRYIIKMANRSCFPKKQACSGFVNKTIAKILNIGQLSFSHTEPSLFVVGQDRATLEASWRSAPHSKRLADAQVIGGMR